MKQRHSGLIYKEMKMKMEMTKSFKSFINKKIEEIQIFNIFEVCEEYLGLHREFLKVVGVGIDSPEESAICKKAEEYSQREIDVCEELKNGMVLFWDYKDGCFPADWAGEEEYFYLFGAHENLPSFKINSDLDDKVYVREGYLYKEVVSSFSLAAKGSPFTSINWEKTIHRVKISDLPSFDKEVHKKHGLRVKAALGLVQIPEWEEVSTQQMGHEY